MLIDEWQLEPAAWDAARRSVDAEWTPGRFLITGSANPRDARVHTGAGRFLTLRMRPLSFAERAIQAPTVSLRALAESGSRGQLSDIAGTSDVALDQYLDESLRSGFPGIRRAAPRVVSSLLDAYIDTALSREVPDLGVVVRRPASLREWLRAYAAATSTTASFESIADAVSPDSRPARSTIIDYRDVLTQLWLLDEVAAWMPRGARIPRLSRSPKHQLADPALAARLLGIGLEALLEQRSSVDIDPAYRGLRDGPFAGKLFEALVTLSLRVYAQPLLLDVSHLRTHGGDHEIDLILQSADGRVIAFEVKLNPLVDDKDVRHLHWLAEHLGDRLIDRVVVTTGPAAYRRADGIAVVPLALIGP